MLSLNVTALGLVAFMCTFHRGTEALRDDVLLSSMFKMCSAVLTTPHVGLRVRVISRYLSCLKLGQGGLWLTNF